MSCQGREGTRWLIVSKRQTGVGWGGCEGRVRRRGPGMTAQIIDGKRLSHIMEQGLASEVALMKSRGERPPGLGVILVGENPASHAYVRNKERFAHRIGFATFDVRLNDGASHDDVARAIDQFNESPAVDGILLQLPLPWGLPTDLLLERIDPRKDADGLHPMNQGLLQKGTEYASPCTPSGVMKLLDWTLAGYPDSLEGLPRASLAGKTAVVVGRSILVGKPVATMLLERNATVTMAHSKTPNLSAVCRTADILVVAVGVPFLVKGEFIKEGAIVLDVGINRLETGDLVGDVAFDQASLRASAITPVPGGVGPMTVAMLMANTLLLRKRFGGG